MAFIPSSTYSQEELDEFKRNSNEQITIDGITKTRYQWTQEQRRLETAVRYQKDIAIAAKASNDDLLRRTTQRNINKLQANYEKISEKAGLIPDKNRMAVAGFRKVKTADELKNPAKYGIIDIKNSSSRGMSNGLRTSRYHTLTDDEIEGVKRDAESLNIPISLLRFNNGERTGFVDDECIINIRGDILPDLNSHLLRDNLTQKSVLAHEYYGHYMSHPSPFRIGDWRDEFRASYKAAINAPNLSESERRDLMLDAYDRAKESGVSVKYNKEARTLIYGKDRSRKNGSS